MVTLESFACDTPVIALNSGALSEVIEHGETGFIVEKSESETVMVEGLVRALQDIDKINPDDCRLAYENQFSLENMAKQHKGLYEKVINQSRGSILDDN